MATTLWWFGSLDFTESGEEAGCKNVITPAPPWLTHSDTQ